MRMTVRRLSRVAGLAVLVALFSMPAGVVQAVLVWQTETVDSAGDVGQYTSLALGSDGRPHISYLDVANRDLKYAVLTSTGWQITTVDSEGDVGWYTSLELDADGQPHISYFAISGYDLKYAVLTSTGWQVTTVDSEGAVGWDTSLALNANGRPHISYYGNTNANLKYAVLTGAGWQIETVDRAGTVGWDTSLELDADGQPHISYFDNTNGALKYAHHDGAGWQITRVDREGYVGLDTSLELDADGRPHISYFDSTGSDDNLKYAALTTGGWQIDTVDTAGFVGRLSSLALDADGQPHISYHDNTNGALKYAVLTGGNWQRTMVDDEGAVGRYSSLALDADGRPRISYADETSGELQYTALVDNAPPSVDAGGPYGSGEGSPISLQATVADADEDELTTDWSYTSNSADPGTTCTFGDDSQVVTTFTCTDDGTFIVTLTANDGLTPEVADSASVTVVNVAPTVTLGEDVELNEGDPFSAAGSFSDLGTNDTHDATVDYGDGSGVQTLTHNTDGSFALSHDYLADDGQYTVEVCVEDDDQSSACDALQVTVLNVAPTIFDMNVELDGREATVTVIATDPAGANDPLSYAFDCDRDGEYDVGPQSETSASCTFRRQASTFFIGVQVSDDDGGLTTGLAGVVFPANLCASNYTGLLRFTDTCQDHETAITLPGNGLVELCASTGASLLRLADARGCSRYEIQYVLPEDGPLHVCVNRYSRVMRVVDGYSQCTSHEFWWVFAAKDVGDIPPPPR